MMNRQRYKEHENAEYSMRGEYINDCEKCGCENSVFSQKDNRPEYITQVIVKCLGCRALISFDIAVN
jgi:hypothetical protein